MTNEGILAACRLLRARAHARGARLSATLKANQSIFKARQAGEAAMVGGQVPFMAPRELTGHVVPASPEIHEDRDHLSG
jgi:hypothetical protein